MIIRFAEERDIPQMLDLLGQVKKVHQDIRPDLFREGTKYDEAGLKQMLADPQRPVLAAEEGGRMVGYTICAILVTQGDPVLKDRKELYIDDLCVDAAVRGKGVSKLLWQRAVEYAKELGCDAITLNVWEGNDRARKFYEHCGLTVRKTMMEYPL